MKKQLPITLMLFILLTNYVNASLVEEKDKTTGQVLSSYDTANTDGRIDMTEGRDIYVDGVLQARWNANAFIGYCMQNFLNETNSEHAYAVIRAVDQNTPEGWALFMQYAQLNGEGELAANIINAAYTAGANVTGD